MYHNEIHVSKCPQYVLMTVKFLKILNETESPLLNREFQFKKIIWDNKNVIKIIIF